MESVGVPGPDISLVASRERRTVVVDPSWDLLEYQLGELYGSELQLLAVLPLINATIECGRLSSALSDQRLQTEEQANRIQSCFEQLGVPVQGTPCCGMGGLIKEALADTLAEGHNELRDAALLADCRRIGRFQRLMYTSAIMLAGTLSERVIASLLDQTMIEKRATEATLAELAVVVPPPPPATHRSGWISSRASR